MGNVTAFGGVVCVQSFHLRTKGEKSSYLNEFDSEGFENLFRGRRGVYGADCCTHFDGDSVGVDGVG